MLHPIQLQHLPARPIAVVRRRVAPSQLSTVIPQACGLVWTTIKAAKVTDAGRHIAIYRHADGGLLDVEIGVEVGSPFAGRDEVVGSATPAGEVATVPHFGPYHKLKEAHQALRQWCADNGRTPSGITWEIYGHWLDEWNKDPSQIRTDVFYLLKS